jgi:FtsH-binding integral membrane protein
MGAGLYSGLCCMLGYGLISMLFGFSTGGLYSMFGAILFCGFIIYDVDQTMHKIGVDDYVMAAINIYLDIINLFLFILQMLSSNDR